MKRKGVSIVTLLIILVIVTIIPFLIIKLGNGIHITNNKVKQYENVSIGDIESKQKVELCVPDIIRGDKELKARVVADTFLEILGEEFVLKIGPSQGYEADPLALYEQVEKDYKYKVTESNKEFIRYRLEYPELTHCTIINWVSNGKSYGMILDRQYTEDEIFSLMGVTPEQTEVYEEKAESKDSGTENNNNQIVVNNKYKFNLPLTDCKIEVVDQDDITLLYIGNNIIMVICKEDTIGFEDSNVYKMGNGYQIKYPNTNIFEEGSAEYSDFDTIRHNMDNIVNSFEVLGGQ